MRTYRPVNKQLLINPVDSQAKTSGGIVLPQSAVKRVYEAEVLALSEELENPKVRPGDVIVYNEHAYERRVKADPEDERSLCFIDYHDVLAVVE